MLHHHKIKFVSNLIEMLVINSYLRVLNIVN